MRNPLILVINLDRSPDRWAAMAAHLSALDLPFCRIAAVDGATIDLTLIADAERYRRSHGHDLRAAEVGCYFSHLMAMASFLATPALACIILEDDARVCDDFAALMTELMARDLCGFDVLRLQGRRRGWGITSVKGEHWSIKVHATRVTGSTGYLLNRKAAMHYLDGLLPMEVPFDHAFDRALHLGLRIGAVLPYPVSTSDVPSTIETDGADSRHGKVVGLARWTVMAWRTRTEVARVVAFLSEITRLMTMKFRGAGGNAR